MPRLRRRPPLRGAPASRGPGREDSRSLPLVTRLVTRHPGGHGGGSSAGRGGSRAEETRRGPLVRGRLRVERKRWATRAPSQPSRRERGSSRGPRAPTEEPGRRSSRMERRCGSALLSGNSDPEVSRVGPPPPERSWRILERFSELLSRHGEPAPPSTPSPGSGSLRKHWNSNGFPFPRKRLGTGDRWSSPAHRFAIGRSIGAGSPSAPWFAIL